jgi:hypothetical protein
VAGSNANCFVVMAEFCSPAICFLSFLLSREIEKKVIWHALADLRSSESFDECIWSDALSEVVSK